MTQTYVYNDAVYLQHYNEKHNKFRIFVLVVY